MKAMKRIYANQSLVIRLSLLVSLLPLLYSLLSLTLFSPNQSIMATSTTTEVLGVKIHNNPPQSMLTDLEVATWPKWEGGLMKIPWSFKEKETMYLLEGKVKVTVDGHGDDDGSFEIGGGDLVVFPKGMNITWEVLEAVKKHYHLEEEK